MSKVVENNMPRTSRIIPKILAGSPAKNTKRIYTVLADAQKHLNRWYEMDVALPAVIILQDRKSIAAYWGERRPSWNIAWADRGTIFILDWSIMKLEGRSRKGWEKVLVHEYAHLYTGGLAGRQLPRWLNEGLSCFHADQRRTATREKVEQYFSQSQPPSTDAYAVGYVMVNAILKKFGRKKFLQLLRGFSAYEEHGHLQEIFKKTMRVSWNTFFMSTMTRMK
jgi:hypothetical protein